METVFVVAYYDRYNRIVTQSQEFSSYEDAEKHQQEGSPVGFYYIAYSEIKKRVKHQEVLPPLEV